MEAFAIESWLAIMGMSGLALAAVVGLAMLVRRLVAPKRKARKRPPVVKRSPQFEDEIQVQVFRQQAEKAFQSISAVIDEEYRTLRCLIETGQHPIQVQRRRQGGLALPPGPKSPGAAPRQYDDAGASDGPYARLENYLRQGMSTAEISEALQMPHHEIELAIKLHAARHAAVRG